MILPHHNGHLTAIKGGGFAEGYGQAEGGDADKWTGEVESLASDEILDVSVGGKAARVRRTTLLVPSTVQDFLALHDTVFFTHDDVDRNGEIREIYPQRLLGLVRLHLKDQ